MTVTARTVEVRSVAQAITDALPTAVFEVVLTGSVSRGVADGISDIEMLLVSEEDLGLSDCFSLAESCGLTNLGTWGQQGGSTKRVSGYCQGEPIALIWWSRPHAEAAIDAIFTDAPSGTAEAIANGVALRSTGLLAQWQDRLRNYPDELADARIEDAALKWGGFHAAGLLTLVRRENGSRCWSGWSMTPLASFGSCSH